MNFIVISLHDFSKLNAANLLLETAEKERSKIHCYILFPTKFLLIKVNESNFNKSI